ncbi:ATP-binding protein [Limosilactobacillus sp. STM2_1]|uniref:ATP-binding protein n=1 Tax=Limosilactobacillus rudii TaxID=2759755 RepID=A0A7W3UKW7_9LACO|nr:ATP-binding protein [Limosilactobacillus rudii]MBB1079340.1 ATP-binding protein [Limosilactobacillus rudii]MBB1097386.1 ATP-binding protein [Limosilactobacillus rudii]MCD7134495.1 ATP-binding protein [Limosilactobacillus rudii]
MALTYQQLLTAVPLVLDAGNVPNIVGDAGIGKSALVQEIATNLGAELFTTVVSLSEKGDLAIPVPPLTSDSFVETQNYGRLANVQFGYSETLISIIKHAENHPSQPIIWFLDEFNRGTQAVQSELMNLVLQRKINALKLPSTVKIIIAENPDTTMAGFTDRDYGVAIGDAAIKDRTIRLVMTNSTTEWLKWARSNNLNDLVVKYLTQYPERLLIIDSNNEDLAPTPRAWERVAKNLDQLQALDYEVQKQLAADLFSGDLGSEIGVSFAQFVLAQGHELTIKVLKEAKNGKKQFAECDDATKIRLLRSWLHEDLATEKDAQLFNEYFQLVSPDGQYAIAQSVGEQLTAVLQPMYEQAIKHPHGNVADLYKEFAKVATRGDN